LVHHCSDYRIKTSSAFGVVVRFDEEDFKITTNNKAQKYLKSGGSANQISRNFCPNCGSTVLANLNYIRTLLGLELVHWTIQI
jgi:hypothetical protein